MNNEDVLNDIHAILHYDNWVYTRIEALSRRICLSQQNLWSIETECKVWGVYKHGFSGILSCKDPLALSSNLCVASSSITCESLWARELHSEDETFLWQQRISRLLTNMWLQPCMHPVVVLYKQQYWYREVVHAWTAVMQLCCIPVMQQLHIWFPVLSQLELTIAIASLES